MRRFFFCFDRAYAQEWTGEKFNMKGRFKLEGVSVYTLVDWDNECVAGKFYKQEVQAVNVNLFAEYLIENIFQKTSSGALVTLI